MPLKLRCPDCKRKTVVTKPQQWFSNDTHGTMYACPECNFWCLVGDLSNCPTPDAHAAAFASLQAVNRDAFPEVQGESR